MRHQQSLAESCLKTCNISLGTVGDFVSPSFLNVVVWVTVHLFANMKNILIHSDFPVQICGCHVNKGYNGPCSDSEPGRKWWQWNILISTPRKKLFELILHAHDGPKAVKQEKESVCGVRFNTTKSGHVKLLQWCLRSFLFCSGGLLWLQFPLVECDGMILQSVFFSVSYWSICNPMPLKHNKAEFLH